jgi:hypothetical protein
MRASVQPTRFLVDGSIAGGIAAGALDTAVVGTRRAEGVVPQRLMDKVAQRRCAMAAVTGSSG